MMEDQQKLEIITQLILTWLNKQGQDKCHYYPDIFNEIAKILNITQNLSDKLPERCEFEKGCKQYQDELYNKGEK